MNDMTIVRLREDEVTKDGQLGHAMCKEEEAIVARILSNILLGY